MLSNRCLCYTWQTMHIIEHFNNYLLSKFTFLLLCSVFDLDLSRVDSCDATPREVLAPTSADVPCVCKFRFFILIWEKRLLIDFIALLCN